MMDPTSCRFEYIEELVNGVGPFGWKREAIRINNVVVLDFVMPPLQVNRRASGSFGRRPGARMVGQIARKCSTRSKYPRVAVLSLVLKNLSCAGVKLWRRKRRLDFTPVLMMIRSSWSFVRAHQPARSVLYSSKALNICHNAKRVKTHKPTCHLRQ
jgi:hypothetical protein